MSNILTCISDMHNSDDLILVMFSIGQGSGSRKQCETDSLRPHFSVFDQAARAMKWLQAVVGGD